MNIIYYENKLIKIVDDTKITSLNGNLQEYLNTLCLKNGSSLKGRIDSFNYITKSKQKTPIVISFNNGEILMPLLSIYSNYCILLNYCQIKKITKIDDNKTLVIFINDDKIEFDINFRIINKQIKRVKSYINYARLNNIYTNSFMYSI